MKNIQSMVFCALMTAMTLLFLFIGVLMPAGRFGLCAAAGLPAVAAVIRHGLRDGLLTWIASSALALLMLPVMGTALLYVLVFGLYAPLKNCIERLRRLPLEWLCKLLFAGAEAVLFVVAMPSLLAENIVLPEWGAPALVLLGVAVFAVYDLALSRLIGGMSHLLRRRHQGN